MGTIVSWRRWTSTWRKEPRTWTIRVPSRPIPKIMRRWIFRLRIRNARHVVNRVVSIRGGTSLRVDSQRTFVPLERLLRYLSSIHASDCDVDDHRGRQVGDVDNGFNLAVSRFKSDAVS